MKVKELIAILLDMPMDSDIFTYNNGGYFPLESEKIELDKDNDVVLDVE